MTLAKTQPIFCTLNFFSCIQIATMAKCRVIQSFAGNAIQTSADGLYLARHVALKIGLPQEVPAVTINRLCGSGFQCVVDACHVGNLRSFLVFYRFSQYALALHCLSKRTEYFLIFSPRKCFKQRESATRTCLECLLARTKRLM